MYFVLYCLLGVFGLAFVCCVAAIIAGHWERRRKE